MFVHWKKKVNENLDLGRESKKKKKVPVEIRMRVPYFHMPLHGEIDKLESVSELFKHDKNIHQIGLLLFCLCMCLFIAGVKK